MKGHQFRFYVWDPCLIIWQIASLQFSYYAIFGAVSYLFARTVEADVTLDLIFSAHVSRIAI